MKKIILILCLLSAAVFADQKLENVIETAKTQDEIFSYAALTKINIFGELQKLGFKLEKKNVYYYFTDRNSVAKVKIAKTNFNYDTKPSNTLGYVLRDKKELTFTPNGQRVEKDDWYTLEYNKILKIYVAGDRPGDGHIVTFKPMKNKTLNTSAEPVNKENAVEQHRLITITEKNDVILEPTVQKKSGIFNWAKEKITGNK